MIDARQHAAAERFRRARAAIGHPGGERRYNEVVALLGEERLVAVVDVALGARRAGQVCHNLWLKHSIAHANMSENKGADR